MSYSEVSRDKGRRIESLWKELRRTKTHTPSYEAILGEIRSLLMDSDAIPQSCFVGKDTDFGEQKNPKARLDRADAIVRVAIDSLNEGAAQRALRRANREAMRR